MKRLILALAMVVMVSPAWGAVVFKNGNKLLSDCNESLGSHSEAFCIGYIMGVYDAIQSNDGTLNGFTNCSGDFVVNGQIRDVVVKWLKDNPQHRHNGASGLISHALQEAFPCQ